MGIIVEDPEFIEVGYQLAQENNGLGYIKHCDEFPFEDYKFIVVVIRQSS